MSIKNYAVNAIKTMKSYDGIAYSCNLLKNGKKVAEVYEAGNGGELEINWLDGNTNALVKTRTYDDKPHSFNGTVEEAAFYEEVMKLPKLAARDELPEMYPNAHIVIDEMVNDVLDKKTIEKDLKKNFVVKTKDGKFLTWKITKDYSLEKLKKHVSEKYNGCLVVNDLDIEDVIDLYKEANLM